MDISMIVKASCGVIAAIVTLLQVTHNISPEVTTWINGVTVMILGVFTANDHNTSK
jgi:hypothetical protein